jgi:hypothetical protein
MSNGWTFAGFKTRRSSQDNRPPGSLLSLFSEEIRTLEARTTGLESSTGRGNNRPRPESRAVILTHRLATADGQLINTISRPLNLSLGRCHGKIGLARIR